MSRKWQRNLHSLFTMNDQSLDITEEVEASSERYIVNLPDAVVDDNDQILMKALKMKTMTDCYVY